MLCVVASATSAPAIVLENAALRVSVATPGGGWTIRHKTGGNTTWDTSISTNNGRFARLTLTHPTKGTRTFNANQLTNVTSTSSSLSFTYTPPPNAGEPALGVRARFTVAFSDPTTIRLSYAPEITDASQQWSIASVSLMDDFGIRNDGYFVVPIGGGLGVPSSMDYSLSTTFSYDNEYRMRLLGLVKGGSNQLVRGTSAIAVYWPSPYTGVSLLSRSEFWWRQMHATVTVTDTAREVYLHFIPQGGFVEIAKKYRAVVQAEGTYWKTLDEKMEDWTAQQRAMVSSVMFIPFFKQSLASTVIPILTPIGYDLFLGTNLQPGGPGYVAQTFSELEDVARRLKNDLQMDHVYFNMLGCMNGGHDRKYNDLFPADAQLGGNAGFAQLCQTLGNLGFLHSAYFNPSHHFLESTSTNASNAFMNRDGSRYRDDVYAGGPAYRVSPAASPAHMDAPLDQLRSLCGPSMTYLDYLLLPNLTEDWDPAHSPTHAPPRTKQELMGDQLAVIQYARDRLVGGGSVAEENPREYAAATLDRFYKWHDFTQANYIPLNELIFREVGIFGT